MPADELPALQTIITRVAEAFPPGSHKRAEMHRAFHRHHVRFWHDNAALFSWRPEELIDAIRADGALDVVAHPVRCRDGAAMQRALDYAAGVEVYTSRHSGEVAARFLAYAEERGKHWTASVDDHQHVPYAPPQRGTPRRTVDRIVAGC